MEYFKQIAGYPHLFISNKGRVFTLTYKRFLKQHITNRGYMRVCLSKDKTVKHVHVHKLVAEAFIPNPDNLPTVDHIDGNKLNNCVENLRWLSYSDNIRKAQKDKDKLGVPIPVICVETGKVYKSMKEAATELHITSGVMSSLARGEYNGTYRGLHFKYYNE